MKKRCLRGTTLVEIMVVVAIMGIIAGLAGQNVRVVASAYRAREDGRAVLSALAGGRGLAYRRNEPVLMTINQDSITYSIPDFASPPTGFTITVPGWKVAWTLGIPQGVLLVSGGGLDVGTTIAFCPSGEYRFLDGPGTTSPLGAGGPMCGIANMANRSGDLRFTAHGQNYRLNVRAPLAIIDLKVGH